MTNKYMKIAIRKIQIKVRFTEIPSHPSYTGYHEKQNRRKIIDAGEDVELSDY